MTVCRLCLTASHDVIHIFREVGVQLKVSSILSKHFGSLFEVGSITAGLLDVTITMHRFAGD